MKNGLVPMPNFNLVVASQSTPISAPQKWKLAFSCVERENFLLQHRKPPQDAHVCIIWAYYHKLCPDSSHNIGHLTRKPRNLEHDRSFCEGFFETYSIYQVWYFYLQLCHIIRHHAKDFHYSDFFEFVMPVLNFLNF